MTNFKEGERLPEKPVTETATEARQGRKGKPVLIVLIGGLFLAAVAWAGAELWGESTDKDPPSKPSTTSDPINAQPKGEGAFDNNPAGGGSQPPEATDRNPNPSGSGSGPTGVTTPSGAEKVR